MLVTKNVVHTLGMFVLDRELNSGICALCAGFRNRNSDRNQKPISIMKLMFP